MRLTGCPWTAPYHHPGSHHASGYVKGKQCFAAGADAAACLRGRRIRQLSRRRRPAPAAARPARLAQGRGERQFRCGDERTAAADQHTVRTDRRRATRRRALDAAAGRGGAQLCAGADQRRCRSAARDPRSHQGRGHHGQRRWRHQHVQSHRRAAVRLLADRSDRRVDRCACCRTCRAGFARSRTAILRGRDWRAGPQRRIARHPGAPQGRHDVSGRSRRQSRRISIAATCSSSACAT